MAEHAATLLARHASWSPAAQAALAASPPTRDLVTVNRHLCADVVTALADGASRTRVLALLDGLRGDLPGLAACIRRAAELTARHGRQGTDDELDEALAQALLRADTAQVAARALADVADLLPLGYRTAEVMLLLGGPLATVAVAALTRRRFRLRWLAGPDGRRLSDDEAWALLCAPDPVTTTQPWELFARTAAVLWQRPALRDRDTALIHLSQAQLLLDRAEVLLEAGDDDRSPWRRWYAWHRRVRPRLRRIEEPLMPWALAALARRPDLTGAQRRTLRAGLRDPWLLCELGAAAPDVGAAAGLQVKPHPAVVRDLSFTDHHETALRREGDNDPDPLPAHVPPRTPLSYLDEPLAQAHGADLGGYLSAQLADPDPAVEAARWSVALSLADDFTGTLAELADVATTVTAPA